MQKRGSRASCICGIGTTIKQIISSIKGNCVNSKTSVNITKANANADNYNNSNNTSIVNINTKNTISIDINKIGIKDKGKRPQSMPSSISLAFALTLLTLFALFALDFSLVFAQQDFFWCIETKTGKICQPNTLSEQCNGPVYLERPQACEEVDCILESGVCQSSVPRKVCEEQGGRVAKPEEAEKCIEGCCIIAGQYNGIITRAECEYRASQQQMLQFMDFNKSIKSEAICMERARGFEKGCCFTSNFDCAYTTRESCVAPYFVNSYCSEIPQCNAIGHFKQACGDAKLGDNLKLCWFDSKGNQEDCFDCGYPSYVCDVCKEETCKDEKRKTEVNKFQPYCKSTKCDLSNAKGSQVLRWENGKMVIEWKKPPSVLLSGDSICYNFYTGQAHAKQPDTYDNGFARRSTGLQNQVVRCSLGEIEIDGLGVDRNMLCFEKDGKTHVEKNKYYNCMKCGKPVTKIEKYQQKIQEKQEQLEQLQEELQKMMEEKGLAKDLGTADIATLLSDFPELLEKYKQIQNLQKEIEEEAEKMDLEWYDFIGVFGISMVDSWADSYTRGAILPGFGTLKAMILYQLGGSKCTKDSCESEKFSNGESYCVWRSETGASGLKGVILWPPADAACVPRYPPGVECGSCGGTGDNDKCDEPEAWAAGNCIFEPENKVRKPLLSIPEIIDLYFTTRFNTIPYYTAFGAFFSCGGNLICFGIKWLERVGGELGKWGLYAELLGEIAFAGVMKIVQESTT